MVPTEIVVVTHGLMVDRYANTAGAAMWFYDYLLTLPAEYEHIWKKEWSLVKVLYLLNRYTTLPFLILVVYHLDGEQRGPLSTRFCIFYDISATFLRWIQLVASTWLILIVVQSLSLNSRCVRGFLYTSFAAMTVTVAVFGYITLREMYPTIIYLEIFRVCHSIAPNSTRWLYMCQVPFDALLLAVELFYYWRFHRLVAPAQPTKLITTLYLDGVCYFAATITVKLSAGLVVFFADPYYWYIAASADQAFTSTFIARLVLHLRSTSSQSSSNSYTTNPTSGVITGTDIYNNTMDSVPERRHGGEEDFFTKTYRGHGDEEWRHGEADVIEMDIRKQKVILISGYPFRRGASGLK